MEIDAVELPNVIDLWKDHAKWYRIPERESITYPLQKFPEGSFVEADRFIIRAGYYWQPEDMPEEVLEYARAELVAMNTNRYERATPQQKEAIDFHYTNSHIYPDSLYQNYYNDPIALDTVHKVLHTITTWGNTKLSQIDYELRGRWYARMNKNLPQDVRWFRTFWYVDYKHFMGQVRSMPVKQIGYRYAGSVGTWDSDYEPPSFGVKITQRLYCLGELPLLQDSNPHCLFLKQMSFPF